MTLMKSNWFRHLATILALMFCMSVMYFPAYAVEVGWEWDEDTVYDEQLGIVDADTITDSDADSGLTIIETTEVTASDVALGTAPRPFTPPGTGTVVDSATNGDGKEFYTIKTEDDCVFYLIIDRQRNAENVYFLNAVTEADLMALAEKNGNPIINTASTAQPMEQPGEPAGQVNPPPTTPEPEPKDSGKSPTTYLFIGIVVLAVGGAAYYFKIVKGKKDSYDDDEDEDAGDEYGYEGEPKDGDYDDETEEGGDNE